MDSLSKSRLNPCESGGFHDVKPEILERNHNQIRPKSEELQFFSLSNQQAVIQQMEFHGNASSQLKLLDRQVVPYNTQNLDNNVKQKEAKHMNREIVPYDPGNHAEHQEIAPLFGYNPCTEVYNPAENYAEVPRQPLDSVMPLDAVQPSLPDLNIGIIRERVERPRRNVPKVGAYTVQCARCLKWRFVPSKQEFEIIRQYISENPWVCENANSWERPLSCEDPPDIVQDDNFIWAMDKPNISQPPPGWERLLAIRSEGASKFADIYYVSPAGVKLRSMIEVQRYLFENPIFLHQGVTLSQFSFQIPKPHREDYVRKRQVNHTPEADFGHTKKLKGVTNTKRSQNASQAKPVSRRRTGLSTKSRRHFLQPELWRAFMLCRKKKRSSNKRARRVTIQW